MEFTALVVVVTERLIRSRLSNLTFDKLLQRNMDDSKNKMRGTVKFFCKRGYGFITDQDGKEWFFHHSGVIMKGYKRLDKDDIVDFEIGNGNNGREQAVNVTPILTLKMVEQALKKEKLYLQIAEDDYGTYYRVVANNVIQAGENGMSLSEVAAFAGFDVEGLLKVEERD